MKSKEKKTEITKKVISKSQKLFNGTFQQEVVYKIPERKGFSYITKHEPAFAENKIVPSLYNYKCRKERKGICVRVWNPLFGMEAPAIYTEATSPEAAIREARSLSGLSRFDEWRFTTNKV